MSAQPSDRSTPAEGADKQRPRDDARTTDPKADSKPEYKTEADGGPALQGEGNYTAARRHRESAEQFVESGAVEPAARDAAPQTADEAREMAEAEKAGRAHARR